MSHVILTTPPTQGHIRPALRLAEVLAAHADHYCTVVLPMSSDKVKQRDNIDHDSSPSGGEFSSSLPATSDRVCLLPVPIPTCECGRNVGLQWKWLELHRAELIVYVERHLSRGPFPKPSAVILDQFSSWSFDLAEQLSVPSFVFLASPLFFLYLAYNEPALLQIGDQARAQSADLKCPVGSNECVLEIPGLGRFTLEDVPSVHTDRHGWNYRFIKDCFAQFRRAAGFIANDVESLAPNFVQHMREAIAARIGEPRLWPIGPVTTLPQPRAVQPELRAWLDEHQDVVYVAFGSWCVMPQDHLALFCRGLEQSGRPFVWAYRPLDPDHWTSVLPEEEQRKLEPEDPTQFESDGLPKGFRSRVSGRGQILPWVDQTFVLQHPHVTVFATHCGWNSLLESLCAKPLTYLCVPLAAEQSLNAAIVEKVWGSGLRAYCGGGSAPVRPPCPDAICYSLQRLNEDPIFRERAEFVRHKVITDTTSAANTRDLALHLRSLAPKIYDVGLP